MQNRDASAVGRKPTCERASTQLAQKGTEIITCDSSPLCKSYLCSNCWFFRYLSSKLCVHPTKKKNREPFSAMHVGEPTSCLSLTACNYRISCLFAQCWDPSGRLGFVPVSLHAAWWRSGCDWWRCIDPRNYSANIIRDFFGWWICKLEQNVLLVWKAKTKEACKANKPRQKVCVGQTEGKT